MLMSLGTAQAQDVEYLLEGQDKKRGAYTGKLLLSYGAEGAVTGDRRVTYRDGVEALLKGTGERVDFGLDLKWTVSGGLSGTLGGGSTQAPIIMEASLGELEGVEVVDAWISTTSRQNGKIKSTGDGYLVIEIKRDGRPAPKSTSHDYKTMKGVAFIRGEGDAHEVDVNDVSQGGLGDCYFMAGIASVAKTDPQRIRDMIQENEDGTFTVYLWKHDYQWEEEEKDEDGFFFPTVRATKIVVDGKFPAGYGTSPSYADFGDSKEVDGKELHELWPMILEKAYAKHKGSFGKIEGGWASTPISFFSGNDAVVDHDPTELAEEKLTKVLAEAVKKGFPTTMGVPAGGGNPSLNVYANHYYIFVGLDEEGRVQLRNPWGTSHPKRALTLEEFKKTFDSIHVGEF